MGRWGVIVVSLLLAQTSDSAASRCDRRASTELLREGKRFFDLGRYDEAIERWERAYLACDDPALIFNLAQAHRKAGYSQKAIELYRRWLQLNPGASPEERADVERTIAELETQLAEQPAVDVLPPPVEPEPLPAPDPMPEPPVVRVLVPPPAPRVVVPPPRWYHDRWGWTLAGAGVLVTGAGLVLLAQDQRNDPDEPLRQQTQPHTLGGALSTSLGLGLLAGGVVKLVLTEPAPTRRSTEIACSLGFCSVRGTF